MTMLEALNPDDLQAAVRASRSWRAVISSQVLGRRRAMTVREYADYIVGRAPSAPVYARRRVLD